MGRAFVIAVLFASTSAFADTPGDEIAHLIDRLVDATNRSDAVAWAALFERSTETTIYTDDTSLHGWDEIARGAADRLSTNRGAAIRLAPIRVDALASRYALVRATFRLERRGSVERSGFCTLLLHRARAGWRIAHYHAPTAGELFIANPFDP